MSCLPSDRWQQPGQQSASATGYPGWCSEHRSILYHERRPSAEVRFVRNSDGSPDGGVHGLFTIRGRTDAEGCNLTQPNFAQQLAAGNVIFRIPTPTFGLGSGRGHSRTQLCRRTWRQIGRDQVPAGHQRRSQHQRQRRHGHALWLEGAEQVADGVRGRSLQRRTGRLE